MTSLVLGAAGAAVGFAVGGPFGASVGWTVGSMVGTLIDPPKSQGPRLGDLKLQKASYGQMIPIVWGRGRLAGIVIDQTDLQEHSHKSGGKGGPQVTNYTYTASFDILLCQTPVFGEPALSGISRIWWNARLFWDAATGEEMPCTFYDGSDDQMPDPTFEAVHSPDPVPAHRGFAHVVFTDRDLIDGGNSIGNWEFEVTTVGEGITGSIRRIEEQYDSGHTFSSGFSLSHEIPAITYWPWSGGNIRIKTVSYPAPPVAVAYYEFDRASLTEATPGPTHDDYPIAFRLQAAGTCPGGGDSWYFYPIGMYVYADDSAVQLWCHPGFTIGISNVGPAVYDGAVTLPDCGPPRSARNILHDAGLPSGEYVGSATLSANGKRLFVFTSPTNPAAGGAVIDKWYEIIDGDLTRSGTVTPHLSMQQIGFGVSVSAEVSFTASSFEDNGKYCWTYFGSQGAGSGGGPSGGAVVYYMIDDAGNFALSPYPGTYFFATDTAGGTRAMGEPPTSLTVFLQGSIRVIKTGYAGVIAGDTLAVFTRFVDGSEDVIRLSEIVGNLSDMTPAAPVRDVSELEDIPVNWYAVASQMTVRNAIQPLRQAFFFDAVESDDAIKFRLRDGSSIATIPDDDLCAHAYGEDPGTPLKTVRKKEFDLPRNVSFAYIDIDADYQEGTQSAPRQVTMSQSDVTVQVPIGFTAAEAAQRCMTLQTTEWVERETFEWSTSRKWAKLEPCDIVTVRGRDIRTRTRTEQPDGVIKWSGVLAAPSIQTQSIGGDPGHFVPQEPPPPPQLTALQLLDIPLITDPAKQNVYEAAMAGADRAQWRGASLQRSVDGGTTYSELVNSLDPDIIGTADDALPTFLGGNVFDEVNILHVTIGPGGGELSSTTYEGVLNGVNEFLLGREVLQARDAVLVADSTYRLTGLLRGRRGTEWAMTTHIEGERFVVLPANNELSFQTTDLGVSRQYKAVTNGSTLASADAQTFVLRGVSMTPYSPVFPCAGTNASGDWILQWVRRARVNGAWLNFTEVPLDEPTEQYVVTLWTDNLYVTVASTVDCATTTTTITAAQQTAIFGAPQSELFWSVAQIGRLGPGYDTLGRAPTVVTPPPTVPVLPTTPTDAIYLGELHFDGSQITSEGVTGTKVAYGLIAIPNPLPAGWSGQQTYVSIFESGSGTYAKRMYLSRSPFDYTPVYPAYGEGNGSANIYMVFNAASAFAVTVAPGEIWYLTIKNELPDGTPSCPPGGNGNFGLRMYPPNI